MPWKVQNFAAKFVDAGLVEDASQKWVISSSNVKDRTMMKSRTLISLTACAPMDAVPIQAVSSLASVNLKNDAILMKAGFSKFAIADCSGNPVHKNKSRDKLVISS